MYISQAAADIFPSLFWKVFFGKVSSITQLRSMFFSVINLSKAPTWGYPKTTQNSDVQVDA